MTHSILHPASKEMEKPHVPDDMEPARVDKHVGEEREVVIKREPVNVRPSWIRVPCGDETEEIEHCTQDVFGEGDFKDEDDPI